MRLTRRGRIIATLGVLLLILAVIALPGVLYLRSIGLLKESAPRGRVPVVIPRGASNSRIGEILEMRDVVSSAFGFRIAVYLDGGAPEIQAGRYVIATGLSAQDALVALKRGPEEPEVARVTFPEGSWLEDFAAVLERETNVSGRKFLRLTKSGRIDSRFRPDAIDTLEGLLFPSTYEVGIRDDAMAVATRLAEEFEERMSELDLSRARDLGVTPYEAITVASMIEAEAAVDEERGLISRVIYNRLDQGIRLGIDATIIYALGEHRQNLTPSDLQVDSPYNTRLVDGLPPTPIGAPGLASLKAALKPEGGDWLYYVLEDCEGHHAFSETYEEFQRDKAAYQALEC